MAKEIEQCHVDESNKERRRVDLELTELRADDGDTHKLTGYAAKYGVWTDIGWFKERIKKGAFDEALKTSDARCLFNHDSKELLGRESSGTLRIKSNGVGLWFEVDVPDTTTGQDVWELVKRGDLAGCSFSFTVEEDERVSKEDGSMERTITKIGRLYDVGPVTYPAYEDTTVVARSIEGLRKNVPQPTTPELPAHQAAAEPEPRATVPESPVAISPERAKDIRYAYEEMGRIINHVKDKNGSPDA